VVVSFDVVVFIVDGKGMKVIVSFVTWERKIGEDVILFVKLEDIISVSLIEMGPGVRSVLL